MSTERRLFTAELQRLRQKHGDSAALGLAAAPSIAGPAAGEDVVRAIQELRDEIKALGHLIRHDEPPPPAHPAEPKGAEVAMLKTELRALAVCIEQTKAEIAALRPRDAEEDRLMAVTYELDAIVTATERATQTILEAAEKIETISKEIQSNATDAYVGRLVDDINETIISIFEACNFQDITGQRITKVVRTLKYVEARINAMIEIWGAEQIATAASPSPAEEHHDEEAKLLNGPQLENKGISQDEIDKLFG